MSERKQSMRDKDLDNAVLADLYEKAVARLEAMDSCDGGETPQVAIVTAIFALSTGLCRTKCEDDCVWDSYAMLVKAVRQLSGRDIGAPQHLTTAAR
jgi:hypothetical protein